MNRKIAALATSLVIGGTMLGTTAFASANTSSGYNTYKNALLNMRNVKSMTDTIKASATDNGTSFLSADMIVKMNKTSEAASGDINVKGLNGLKEIDVYRQNGKMIEKSSNSSVYDVVNISNKQVQDMAKEHDTAKLQGMENIVDSIIGSRTNYFVLTNNSDGTKSVNVTLSENQISPVINAVVSTAIKEGESKAANVKIAQNQIYSNLPKLVSDIRVTNVDATAVIDKNGVLTSQNGTLTLEGKDASGVNHTIVLNLAMKVSNVNTTTPDTVNLTGKQIKTITVNPGRFEHMR